MKIYQTHCLCGSQIQELLSWVVLAQGIACSYGPEVTGAAVIRIWLELQDLVW